MAPEHWWEKLGEKARRACYEQWVREHAGDLYRFALRLCGDPQVAEDLVQETFYQAWRGRGRLRDAEKARSWLFQILRYRHSHWARSRAGDPLRPAPGFTDLEAFAEQAGTAPAAPGAQPDNREALQAALNQLDDRFKLPLLMVFVQGLTCRGVAEQLDVPLGTVLSRIHRARGHLRRALAGATPARGEPPEQESLRRADEPPTVFRPRFGRGGES